MMKAVRLYKKNDVDSLVCEECPIPEIDPGEVRAEFALPASRPLKSYGFRQVTPVN